MRRKCSRAGRAGAPLSLFSCTVSEHQQKRGRDQTKDHPSVSRSRRIGRLCQGIQYDTTCSLFTRPLTDTLFLTRSVLLQ